MLFLICNSILCIGKLDPQGVCLSFATLPVGGPSRGGSPLCITLPWVFGLGGLGVFGSGDFVHVFSFLIVVVGPLLDRGTNIFEHG